MRNYPGLTDAQREAIAAALTRSLADTYTLYFKTHAFHWNVEGPQFFGLHSMFEQQYREMWDAIDPMAERIRALGHRAPQSYAEIPTRSKVAEAKGEPTASAMIAELLDGHETVIAGLRDALALAQDARDEATAGLVSARLEVHEKTAWMLAAVAKG